MPLTDQELRRELVSYGEVVPPITQRNREQLHTRLQVLRKRPSSPVKTTSSSRARSPPSPTSARSSTRSRTGRNLIELSDSEAETSSNEYLPSRREGRSVQTRSVAVGRDTDRATPTSPSNITADVEESIARHRREIQQLIDSARDKGRSSSSKISSPTYNIPSTTPFRPSSFSSNQRQPLKPTYNQKPKQPSWFTRSIKNIQSFWKQYKDIIIKILQCLIFGILLGGGLIFLFTKGSEFIPHRKGNDIGFLFFFKNYFIL